jgi:hypothetical protein
MPAQQESWKWIVGASLFNKADLVPEDLQLVGQAHYFCHLVSRGCITNFGKLHMKEIEKPDERYICYIVRKLWPWWYLNSWLWDFFWG